MFLKLIASPGRVAKPATLAARIDAALACHSQIRWMARTAISAAMQVFQCSWHMAGQRRKEGYGFLPLRDLYEGSETEVSGFTDEERAAELKRRDDAIKREAEAQKAAMRRAELARAETSASIVAARCDGGSHEPRDPFATSASEETVVTPPIAPAGPPLSRAAISTHIPSHRPPFPVSP